jgi:hypothetical protein
VSKHRPNATPGSGWLRIGPLLVVLVLTGCQAASTPATTASPSTASATPTQVPSAAPTPSGTPVVTHWEAFPAMPNAPDEPQAVVFSNGNVLVVGNAQDGALWDAASRSWTKVAGFDKPRTNFALVRLHDDRAMVIGGMNDIDQSYVSAVIFDPKLPDAGWVRVQNLMHTARTDPSAMVLADGRVLVAGGYFRVAPQYGRLSSGGIVLASARGTLADVAPENVGAAMATAELFNPATGQWTETGHMVYARYDAPAALLADGRVLVASSNCSYWGGFAVTVDEHACRSAEIYDPSTGSFSLAGSLPDMDFSGYDFPHDKDNVSTYPLSLTGSLVPLPDGGAALIGTYGGAKMSGGAIRSFRFYPDNLTWRQIGAMYLHHVIITPDGEMLGDGFETTDVIARLAPMVASLRDGRLVIAGGDHLMGSPPSTTATAELYDAVSDTWGTLPDMPEALAAGAALTLPDGSALLLGGHRIVGTDGASSGPSASVLRLVIGD